MASIFTTHELRDYFITQGYTSTIATAMEVYVLRAEAASPGAQFARDITMIRILESFERPIIDVAVGTFLGGISLSAANIRAWIAIYRSDLNAIATFLSNAIYTDLTAMLGSLPAAVDRTMYLGDAITQVVPTYSFLQAGENAAVNILSRVTKMMRHFAGNDVQNADHTIAYKGLPDIFSPDNI
jgi:hypothetical protein